MSDSSTIRLAQWILRTRLRRFLFLAPFWTLAYRVGEYGFSSVFGWTPLTWAHALMWGVAMAAGYAFWPRGLRAVSPKPGH